MMLEHLLLEQMMFLETKVKLSFKKKINYVNYTFILQKIIYWISVCFSFNSVDLRNYFHYKNRYFPNEDISIRMDNKNIERYSA